MQDPFRSCIHTHSIYCDGKDAPEDMVRQALALGFVSLGFSGHGYAPYDIASMTQENEAVYRTEVRRLQAVYGDRLEILLGQEHDALAPYADYPYDYLLESVHYLDCGGVIRTVDYSAAMTAETISDYFGGDPYAYCRLYYAVCAAAYEKSPAQIAGHVDLVTKFVERGVPMDQEDPRYLGPAKESVACAIERGLVLEINSGAISRGYRTTPYPAPALLRHIRDLGGQVIVTSDCHDRNHLTCHYSQIAELLKAHGFRSTLRLRKQGFEELPL